MTDQALGFWLRHVESAGGLAEPAGDATLVMLPPQLAAAYRLPEEVYVTADPNVAREDGITFLGSGHPVLLQAASALLDVGDTGHLLLDRPVTALPGKDLLLEEARAAFPADHGRLDLTGEPALVTHSVIRVGALITYEMSTEDHFQEQAERWVDLHACRELPARVTSRLASAVVDPRGGVTEPEGLLSGLAEAHRLIEMTAVSRRQTLSAQLSGAHEAERTRAIGYYTDAIAGIEKRLATAPDDRRAVLTARLDSTRQEQARRLAEIAEKYEARHEIRPYRLHVVGVPALRVPVDVRRGDRRYPMRLDWLLPAGAYTPVRCPSCGGTAPLVAGKKNLGCTSCLPKTAPFVPEPRPTRSAPSAQPKTAVKAAQPAQTAKPKPKKMVLAPRKATSARTAEELWRAIATGHGQKVTELLAPQSPALALYRAYGTGGLTRVLGFPEGERPSEFRARVEAAPGLPVICGDLVGNRGGEYNYNLYLRDGLVAEVLPFLAYADGGFWKMYWWGSGLKVGSGTVSVSALDPVERHIARMGPGWNGLAVAARALAAWERLGHHHERLRAGHDPKVLAAAVHRLVTYRAGHRATFADGSAAYRVDEQLMRKADTAMRNPLALGPGQPW